jgi:hypothetical protein
VEPLLFNPNISLQEGYLLIGSLTSFVINYKRESEVETETFANCPIIFDDNVIMLKISYLMRQKFKSEIIL